MANKTTNSLKSQEQSIKAAVQSQIARIKKEEEEDLWISGEELYTEGSSDEEEYKTQSRSRRKVNSNRSSRASSANPSMERSSRSPNSTESKTKDHILQNNVNECRSTSLDTPKSNKTSSSEKSSMESERTQVSSTIRSSASTISKSENYSDFSNEEDRPKNTEISWKANRGTFILPNSSNNAKEHSDKC